MIDFLLDHWITIRSYATSVVIGFAIGLVVETIHILYTRRKPF